VFPATLSHPSKNSPRQQPCRVTAAVALLSFALAPHVPVASAPASAPPPLSWACAPPSPGEPGSGYLALRRSGSLGGPPPPRRSGSGSVRPSPFSCRSRVRAGSRLRLCAPKRARARAVVPLTARGGSGSRLPRASSEESTLPGRPRPPGLLTPSCSLAEAGLLAGDCTQSRDVVGSVEHAPRAWGCDDTEVSGALGARSLSRGWRGTCLATGVARHEPLCEAPRHRSACACWCGLLRCGSRPPSTPRGGWLSAIRRPLRAVAGTREPRVPGSRSGPRACPWDLRSGSDREVGRSLANALACRYATARSWARSGSPMLTSVAGAPRPRAVPRSGRLQGLAPPTSP